MNKIKEIAKQKKITITSIYKNLDISKTNLYDIMNDVNQNPGLITARKIAHELGVSINEVFPEN